MYKKNWLYKYSLDNTVLVLVFLLISRLIAMFFIPLNDSTEARYGEIARIMQETGDWITPMQSYGEPFWAKPPLSIWGSALSMRLFGVNEFAARLPNLLFSIGVLGLIWGLAKKRCGSQMAMTTVLILASCLFFFLNAGTVMTDPALVFCITLSMVAFWQAVVEKSLIWGYLFFVGLGLGLLAKGPIAIVLVAMPIFFWVLRYPSRWAALWKRLPWITGIGLMALIAGPWYAMAEMKTPGFINYFILGENFHRFVDPGWSGDKYGFAHQAPRGIIWLYALVGIFPWTLMIAPWFWRHGKKLFSISKDTDGWASYLWLFTLVPLCFFTFSRNIIYPYVFPSLPAFALLFVELAKRSQSYQNNQKYYVGYATITGMFFILASVLFIIKPEWVSHSQYRTVALFKQLKASSESRLLYWANKTDYSARFYSAGKAIAVYDEEELRRLLLSSNTPDYLVVNSEQKPIPSDIQQQAVEVGRVYTGHEEDVILLPKLGEGVTK